MLLKIVTYTKNVQNGLERVTILDSSRSSNE